jgi:hypothetical protein
MECHSPASGLSASIAEGFLALSGELNRSNSPELLLWLRSMPAISRLDLSELDIDDGVAATYAVNIVRLLRSRVSRLRIDFAPQVLGHNLYRTGVLLDGGVELRDMREDEAYG